MGEEERRQIGVDLLPLSDVSRRLAETHLDQEDWSGLPVPVIGLNLVLEPRYKHKGLEKFQWTVCYDENGVRHDIAPEPESPPSEFRRVNSWWNSRYQVTVVIL